MKKALMVFGDGFEEMEALASVDLMRRGGIPVTTASIMGRKVCESSHQVKIEADALFEELDLSEYDAIAFPGGMPGSTRLNENEAVLEAVREFYRTDRIVAAICAAPMVLGTAGVLEGKKATCYPGFEKYMTGATYTAAQVEQDGNVITGNGPAAAFKFGLALVRALAGDEVYRNVASAAQYRLD